MLAIVILLGALATAWGLAARSISRRDRHDAALHERFDAFAPKPDHDPWARW